MKLLRRNLLPCAAAVVVSSALGASHTILFHDPSFAALVPSAAYEGAGTWALTNHYVAAGHAIDVDALGDQKGRAIQESMAEDDAKRRLFVEIARRMPQFDEGAYDVKGEITGFQRAATYTREGRTGLFLIGIVRKEKVQVQVSFNPAKARRTAIGLFESNFYKEAAERFAALSQKGIQDDETVTYARAAGWHVNLDAGVGGTSGAEALRGLAHFYDWRGDAEASLQHFYELYRETDSPPRQLLEKLIELCRKTKRRDTALKFESEISKRWPPETSTAIKAAAMEKPFERLLLQQPLLLTNGGAGVMQYDGQLYFIAVGVTEVRADTSAEALRRIRVGRIQAQKQAIVFLEQTKVVTEDKFVEKTTIVTKDGKSTVEVFKNLDESTLAQAQGVLPALSDVGTWLNADGSLFFFAVGKKLN